MSMSARVGITRILVMMSLAAARTSYFSHSSLLTSPPTFSTLKYVTFVQAAGHWSHCWSLHHTRLLAAGVYIMAAVHSSGHSETQYTEDPHWAAARPSTDCSLLAACVYSGRVHCTVHCTLYTCTLYTWPAHTWTCSHMGTLSPHSGALCYLVLQSPAQSGVPPSALHAQAEYLS